MLIEFTVSNFRSLKEPVTLSMVAANVKARDPQVDQNNTYAAGGLTLLKTAAIYGANASGKSNLVLALAFLRRFVLNSSRESQAGDAIDTQPFRLSTETDNAPSFFEVIFLLDGTRYRYGFEVDRQHVVAEWLFSTPSTKEARLFLREENTMTVSRTFKEGQGLPARTRSNALFLSVVAQFNGELATRITAWFRRLNILTGLDDDAYQRFTFQEFIEGRLREPIIALVKSLDLGIQDIVQRNRDGIPAFIRDMMAHGIAERPPVYALSSVELKTVHTRVNADGAPVSSEEFDLSQESEGTQKLFFLAGPVIAALQTGDGLIIDEMEARLHPLIMQRLISLFQSPETNPKHAQLIFTTHDTNLLTNRLFRRDQIWFVEKDAQSASHLYSLAELKVRNDASFESDYFQGRYGAIPFLGGMEKLVLPAEAAAPQEPEE